MRYCYNKNYVKDTFICQVFRIELEGKSTDVLVSEIYAKVSERKELLADLEIQKIYAKPS